VSGELQALIGLSTSELEELMVGMGQPAFRGRQIAEWIYKKAVEEIDQMANLPAKLRAELKKAYVVSPIEVAGHSHSSDDVDKLLVHKGDNQVYECVLLPYKDRVSCCLSSQVGCPMGCTFCATGMGGFDRNLSAGEIIAQYLMLQRLSERRVSHVVFMGMGEPLLNYDNVLKALRLLHDEIGLSWRNLTVSTVGLLPAINKFAAEKLPITLALSLHSPIDEIRSRLMPVNNKWPVKEVMSGMRRWHKATGRRVTIEYLLINELNDTPEQARLLAGLLKGVPAHVNLIPFNFVDTGYGYKRPAVERTRAFRTVLESRGVNVTERVERGHDIAAACGQLAGQHKGRFAKREGLSAVPSAS
jgi:23S rRNA (adenine2503-C2)-methyltransferase